MSEKTPKSWENFKINELFLLNTRSIIPNEFPDEKFTYYSLPAFDEFGTSIEVFGKEIESNKFDISEDSILVSKLNPRKPRVMYARPKQFRACASTEFMSYVPKDLGQVSLEYFSHLFFSNSFQKRLELVAIGSTNSHVRVNPTETTKWELAVPPLPEQRKIASILTSVDEVIENTEKQIEKLRDLKKATMNELLTKGIGHTEFKDSELGKIPKSWEIGAIENFSTLVTNGFVGSAAQHYQSSGISYLVSKNIRDNRIDESRMTYISDQFHEKTSKSQLKQGDLLTVQSGHVGTTAVVPKKYDGANCHALILTRLRASIVSPDFVAYYLNSQNGRLRLSNHFVGSTIIHLNTSDLKRFTIPIPKLDEQEEIVKTITTISDTIEFHVRKLEKTKFLKKSLMQDLLTGKVRVKVN